MKKNLLLVACAALAAQGLQAAKSVEVMTTSGDMAKYNYAVQACEAGNPGNCSEPRSISKEMSAKVSVKDRKDAKNKTIKIKEYDLNFYRNGALVATLSGIEPGSTVKSFDGGAHLKNDARIKIEWTPAWQMGEQPMVRPAPVAPVPAANVAALEARARALEAEADAIDITVHPINLGYDPSARVFELRAQAAALRGQAQGGNRGIVPPVVNREAQTKAIEDEIEFYENQIRLREQGPNPDYYYTQEDIKKYRAKIADLKNQLAGNPVMAPVAAPVAAPKPQAAPSAYSPVYRPGYGGSYGGGANYPGATGSYGGY